MAEITIQTRMWWGKEVNDEDPARPTWEQKLGKLEGKLIGNLIKWVTPSILPFSAHVEDKSPDQGHPSGYSP